MKCPCPCATGCIQAVHIRNDVEGNTAALLEYKQWHTSSRAGFTLIEVLLATMLMAVLVAALWNLLSTYMRLFETGHAKTEQSQLARTLLRQVECDLQAALPMARPGRRGGGAGTSSETSRQTASLRGTSDRLELVILETDAPNSEIDSPSGKGNGRANAAAPKAPELRKVVYSFVGPVDRHGADGRLPPGLVRREIPWELDRANGLAARGVRRASTERRDADAAGLAADLHVAATTGDIAMEDARSQSAQPTDDTWLHAPEVIGISLRYFDGRAWSDAWDSLAR